MVTQKTVEKDDHSTQTSYNFEIRWTTAPVPIHCTEF